MKMTVNKIVLFRNTLAEMGMEMTMDEAAKMYVMANDIVSRSKKMSVKDMWDIMEIKNSGMSEEEKEQIVELYRTAKEL
jgi:hypothetical protein